MMERMGLEPEAIAKWTLERVLTNSEGFVDDDNIGVDDCLLRKLKQLADSTEHSALHANLWRLVAL